MRRLHLTLLAALLAAPLAAQPADPHAGHDISATPPAVAPDLHAGHENVATQAAAAADPHAGHVMPEVPAAAPADPMAGHDMSTMAAAAMETPPPPEAFSGPAHAADTLFPATVMAAAREQVRTGHGDFRTAQFLADQLESHIRDGDNAYLWDAQGWYGGDINRIWVKSEGEGSAGDSPEQAELQLLWSHAIAPWWDVQGGVRHDFRPDPDRSFLVLGVQGLMPYRFETDAALFLSDEGDLSARLELDYDQRLTQRLILQPRFELDIAGDDDPERQLGSGITTAELGLRLRYELAREFAPYIGVEYGRSFGHTADYVRVSGEKVGGWSVLLGVRTWF
jgi:copper resistance protein B